MSELVLCETRGAIAILTLNRPEKLNALSPDMLAGIDESIARFRDDPQLRVLLFRAKGRYFCAGADVVGGEVMNTETGSGIRDAHRRRNGGMQRMWNELEAIEKPVVVAHHAICVGGGLELSLSCDFRLAASSAAYSFPEAVFGSLPATGGISRLTRIVGVHWARYLVMANRRVDAQKALVMGLVHEVYPDETFEADTLAFCRHLAGQLPEVMGMAKLAIELARDVDAAQANNIERLANSTLMLGTEFAAGVEAIRQKLLKGKTA